MRAIERVNNYFTEEMIEGPEGLKHSGSYLLVREAYISPSKRIHLRTYPEPFALDEAVSLANYMSKCGDLPGSLRFTKDAPVENT